MRNGMDDQLAALGRFKECARAALVNGETALEHCSNTTRLVGGSNIFVKRDDCTGLAFGGNKVRQLEFFFGEALAQKADTILITGAVQSNYVRMAAAAASKLGMACHIQLEERVSRDDHRYRESGNVLLNRMLGASLHAYPDGEDETGADAALEALALSLRAEGRTPYVIPLAFGHPPLGALGYVVAAAEILRQIAAQALSINHICVASGSGVTHAGLLFGLRALGSELAVTGACVRRSASEQVERIGKTCAQIAELLAVEDCVRDGDISLSDTHLAPGYGVASDAVLAAILTGARQEGLLIDPVYTGKAFATTLDLARAGKPDDGILFVHTGGIPALFAYQGQLEAAL